MDEKEVLSWIRKAKYENWDGLDLSKNHIATLPPEIGELKNLSVLDLTQTGLRELPPEIGFLTKLRILKVPQNELASLPKEIDQLANLMALDISQNHLASMPAEIGKLSELKRLDVSENRLETLPAEIGKLKNLRELRVPGNKLSQLPSSVSQLTNLRILGLGDNEFESIPECIFEIAELRELYLTSNKIAELPGLISKLRNLETLTIGDNPLATLPPEIGRLRSLKRLSLQGSPISQLPNEIMRLTQLKELDLRASLVPIPPEILERITEPQTILNYYADVAGDQQTQLLPKSKALNEIKLLFVGQGSVGKTSLVQRLLHGKFDQSQTKTDGISINQWTIEDGQQTKLSTVGGSSSVKLNVWDFGGQEIMHATHQFFLTKRSLYLLVLDARLTQEENRVEYWLKIIQSFGGDSPVLIIGNKIDQHPLDIDRTGLQKKYPNAVGILETSAATGTGLEILKAEIAKQVEALPHVRDLLPEAWFKIKSNLEELGKEKNFITQDEYLDLCGVNDVTDETSQQTLIGFLHDLGVVLHFQDDPRLEALGILNPQWVTNGVYKILNSHELFQNQGILTLRLLNEILNLPEYPKDKRLFIVDMMKKFELCYDIISDKSFLIPDLLPKDEPFTGEWKGALAFQYHYNVLPTSIITRFIVRMNAFVHKTIWRSGVVLGSGDNTALVKADTEDRKIYILVCGEENTRRDFLSAIRMEFEAIHKTIVKIEATEEVPHPDFPELVLDYAELIEFERQGIKEFPRKVGNQVITCNVRELLDGIRPPKNQAAKVFISYAHKDKSFARKLAGEFERAGMKVWWDFDSLKGGQDWQKEIERGIKQCDFFLVVLTPDAVASDWVGNEITYATLAQKTIIPLHLKTCDLPIGLVKKQYIDFEKQTHKAALKELMSLVKQPSTNE